MNKRELARAVAVQADVDLKTVVTVIDGFTEVVTAVVSKGEPVAITGFAKFVKVNRPARMGRNPATGEAIRIKASKKARITPVKAFKDAVLAPAQRAEARAGRVPHGGRCRRCCGQVLGSGRGQGPREEGAGQEARGDDAGRPRRRRLARPPARLRPEGPPRGSRVRPVPWWDRAMRIGCMRPPRGSADAPEEPPPCRRLADRTLSQPHPDRIAADDPAYPQVIAAHDAALGAGEDTYLDPVSGLMVLTAGFLARRGFCCESGCRHCPYLE